MHEKLNYHYSVDICTVLFDRITHSTSQVFATFDVIYGTDANKEWVPLG